VFAAELLTVESKHFHEACFKCKECSIQLKMGGYAEEDGEFYCKTCDNKIFKGIGAGVSAPDSSSLDDDLKAKQDAKYSKENEAVVREFIKSVTGIEVGSGSQFHEDLKSGVVLCKLLNGLKPGIIKEINTGKMAFHHMENISRFLQGCANGFGMRADTFMSVDLYEAKNMVAVIDALLMLKRKAGK